MRVRPQPRTADASVEVYFNKVCYVGRVLSIRGRVDGVLRVVATPRREGDTRVGVEVQTPALARHHQRSTPHPLACNRSLLMACVKVCCILFVFLSMHIAYQSFGVEAQPQTLAPHRTTWHTLACNRSLLMALAKVCCSYFWIYQFLAMYIAYQSFGVEVQPAALAPHRTTWIHSLVTARFWCLLSSCIMYITYQSFGVEVHPSVFTRDTQRSTLYPLVCSHSLLMARAKVCCSCFWLYQFVAMYIAYQSFGVEVQTPALARDPQRSSWHPLACNRSFLMALIKLLVLRLNSSVSCT